MEIRQAVVETRQDKVDSRGVGIKTMVANRPQPGGESGFRGAASGYGEVVAAVRGLLATVTDAMSAEEVRA